MGTSIVAATELKVALVLPNILKTGINTEMWYRTQ